jgi:hypothetical protein
MSTHQRSCSRYLMYSVTATETTLRTFFFSRSPGVKVHFDSSVV